MGKMKSNRFNETPTEEKSTENLASVRKKRRASQARHRMNVARCYQKLKMSVPGVICENKDTGSPKISSCPKVAKNMNKADMLYRGKEYITHLEETITNLLEKKQQLTPHSTQSTDESEEILNPVSKRIHTFTNIKDFREDFAARFEVDSQVASYFHDTVNTKSDISNDEVQALNTKPIKTLGSKKNSASHGLGSKASSQRSDDQGFVSGGCGSQDLPSASVQCNRYPGPYNNTQTFQTFGSPYGMRYLDVLNPCLDGTFVEASNLYFFVPSNGYSTSYCTTFDEQQSNISGVSPMRYNYGVQGGNNSSTPMAFGRSPTYVQTPGKPRCIFRDVTTDNTNMLSPSTYICNRNVSLVDKMQEQLTSADNSNHQLAAAYEYDETDGTLSPPKICLKGVSRDTESPKTIVVVEKSTSSQDEGISFVA